MGGGAADQSHSGADLRLEPAVLENWCESAPPRLLLRGHDLQEMASLPIPDELVAEIFLRLPTPADLVRASAACTSFRAVVAGRSFLRRLRKLHARPLLGFVEQAKVFHPAEPPHPSASAAKAVALAADFSFSFLPAAVTEWVVQDIRHGRVLLNTKGCVHDIANFYSGMVVCDPLHQQYLLLPPITHDLVHSVDDPLRTTTMTGPEMFLVPPEDGVLAADETSFRVIWMAQCENRVVAFLFSSNTGQWRVISSGRWSDLSAGLPPLTEKCRSYSRYYAHGCFYWLTTDCQESKVLDTKTMEFSFAKLPPEANRCCDLAMVEAGEGRPGLFVLAGRYDLSYFIRRNYSGSSSQWQKVKTISLCNSMYSFKCTTEKHLILLKCMSGQRKSGFFALDIETYQLERVCAYGSYGKLHAYSNFPPSMLSPPIISSGVENKAEKEMLEQGCAASSSAESPRSG